MYVNGGCSLRGLAEHEGLQNCITGDPKEALIGKGKGKSRLKLHVHVFTCAAVPQTQLHRHPQARLVTCHHMWVARLNAVRAWVTSQRCALEQEPAL